MKKNALLSLLIGFLFLCFVVFLIFETQVLRNRGCNQDLGEKWTLPTSNPLVVFPNPAGVQSTGVETLYNAQTPPTQMAIPDIAGVSISTNARDDMYTQVGLLILLHVPTSTQPVILPFMGRALQTARDKWQYYAIGGSIGAGIQTKLPVYMRGKLCSGEYGCDRIVNGDVVQVEGYREPFRVTIYETSLLNYIPVV